MGERNIHERFPWFEALVKAGKYPNASRRARHSRPSDILVSLISCKLTIDRMIGTHCK